MDSSLQGRAWGRNIHKFIKKYADKFVCLRPAEPVFRGDITCGNAWNKINMELRIFN